eukprot:172994_1
MELTIEDRETLKTICTEQQRLNLTLLWCLDLSLAVLMLLLFAGYFSIGIHDLRLRSLEKSFDDPEFKFACFALFIAWLCFVTLIGGAIHGLNCEYDDYCARNSHVMKAFNIASIAVTMVCIGCGFWTCWALRAEEFDKGWARIVIGCVVVLAFLVYLHIKTHRLIGQASNWIFA